MLLTDNHIEGGALSHDFEVIKYCVTDYLSYICSIEATMRAIESDIAYQNARLNLMGISYEGCGGGSSNKDALPDGVAKLMELREKWSDEYAHCADDLEQARELCKPSNVNRYAVWLHYVEKITWTSVGGAIGYSERNVRRIAECGIKELYYAMPEEWRRDQIPNAQVWPSMAVS